MQVCSAVALNGLAMEWAAQVNGQGSLQLLWKVLQPSQSCLSCPACGTQAAAESHSVDVALPTCCALSHCLSLAVLCALCSLVGKEMVHPLCVCKGMAESDIGHLSSQVSQGSQGSLSVLFPSLMVFGSVSVDHNHFLVELLN